MIALYCDIFEYEILTGNKLFPTYKLILDDELNVLELQYWIPGYEIAAKDFESIKFTLDNMRELLEEQREWLTAALKEFVKEQRLQLLLRPQPNPENSLDIKYFAIMEFAAL